MRKSVASLLPCTYFALGAFSLIAQTMLLREFFVVVFGNELVFGLLLGNWLIGIFCGAWLGGWLAEKNKGNTVLFGLAICLVSLLLPLSITATRLLYTISHTAPGTYIGFFPLLGYSALFIIPIGFLIGFVFPLAAKIQPLPPREPMSAHHGNQPEVRGITRIYIFEALGSLVGGIVYTFFLVGRCNAYLIAACFAVPLLFCLLGWLYWQKYYKTAITTGLVLVFFGVFCLPGGHSSVDQKTVTARWQGVSALPLLYTGDSRYQNIAIAGSFGQNQLFLNTKFALVFPDQDDNRILAMHLMCQHPRPQRVLIIGDAVSGLAQQLLSYDIQTVVSVEMDASAVQAVLQFLPPEEKAFLSDPRFRLVYQDGRQYVRQFGVASTKIQSLSGHEEPFDLVYLNVAEPATLLLNRYYTLDFYQQLARVLKPKGVVVLRITGSESYTGGLVGDYAASVYNTLSRVFPFVVITPGSQYYFFAAREPGIVSANASVLAQRYQAFGTSTPRLGKLFYSLYPVEQTQALKQQMQQQVNPQINSQHRPITSLYFNKIIGWYASGNMAGVATFFENIKILPLFLVLLGLVGMRVLYLFFKPATSAISHAPVRRVHVLFAVAAAGLAGISLEIVLLYSFQNNFGSIYYIVGFMIALFMLGLPLGAMVSQFFLTMSNPLAKAKPAWALVGVLLLLAGISILLPWLTALGAGETLWSQVLFFVLTILVGFVVGLLFPLALHLYLGNKGETGRTAGKINAFDHIGAAWGAFFTGTVLLPLLGMSLVCALVALFPFLAALLLVYDIKEKRKTSNSEA